MTSPPCHQESNQAPPSPPWPPSLTLSPSCHPCPTEPSYTLTTLHNYSLRFHESPIAFLSHLPIALDPYTKYSWPPSSNSDQGGSSKVPKIIIEAKNQDKEALEVVSRNPKTPFQPILAFMSSPTHPTPSDVDEECAFPSTNILDYTSTLPNYFPATTGNNSSDFSKNSKNDEIPPIFSPFYNNPYLKDMKQLNVKDILL
ncbi:hypothetical protein Tco_0532996 [Tanacetum coccineum]